MRVLTTAIDLLCVFTVIGYSSVNFHGSSQIGLPVPVAEILKEQILGAKI